MKSRQRLSRRRADAKAAEDLDEFVDDYVSKCPPRTPGLEVFKREIHAEYCRLVVDKGRARATLLTMPEKSRKAQDRAAPL
jgi:hypothetical protein